MADDRVPRPGGLSRRVLSRGPWPDGPSLGALAWGSWLGQTKYTQTMSPTGAAS